MPLILLTGFPASGKSTRTQQLKEYFSRIGKNAVVLSENDIVKNKQIYSGKNGYAVFRQSTCHSTYLSLDASKEKEMRSTLKSEMQRVIGQDDVLILDGGNYIKGIL